MWHRFGVTCFGVTSDTLNSIYNPQACLYNIELNREATPICHIMISVKDTH
jgi:hypothetical protein